MNYSQPNNASTALPVLPASMDIGAHLPQALLVIVVSPLRRVAYFNKKKPPPLTTHTYADVGEFKYYLQ